MATVSAWHSKKDGDVYHNNSKCTKGNNIEFQNKVSGTGGKSLCSECQKLNKDGK
jgi:hypothetical protein